MDRFGGELTQGTKERGTGGIVPETPAVAHRRRTTYHSAPSACRRCRDSFLPEVPETQGLRRCFSCPPSHHQCRIRDHQSGSLDPQRDGDSRAATHDATELDRDRMRTVRFVAWLTLAALMGGQDQLVAQSPIEVSPRVGVSFPLGDIGDETNPGWAVGIALEYRPSSRWFIAVDGSVDILSEQSQDCVVLCVSGSGRVWHYVAGGGLHIARTDKISGRIHAMFGGSTVALEGQIFDLDSVDEFNVSVTAFAADFGLGGAYHLSTRAELFMRADLFVVFTDAQDFADLDDALQVDGATITLPLTVGARFGI